MIASAGPLGAPLFHHPTLHSFQWTVNVDPGKDTVFQIGYTSSHAAYLTFTTSKAAKVTPTVAPLEYVWLKKGTIANANLAASRQRFGTYVRSTMR